MSIGKNDHVARDLWGHAYDDIPKSVFAVMAFYLAGGCVDSAEDFNLVRARILEELDALTGQIIDEKQGKRCLKSAREAFLAAETS
jgi:hypothetical protein